jgi:hypothetical protein
MPESDAALRACFVVHESRLVGGDNTVSVDSIAYEVPRGHKGEVITVTRRLLDGTLHVIHEGRLVEIRKVDLEKNALDRRATAAPAQDDPPEAFLPKSAAEIAFDRDLGPIVGPDGGFSHPDHHPEEEDDP